MAEYIDRDKIISAIIRWEDKPYFSYYAVLRDVMNLPSADVAERKCGKWLRTPTFWAYCSVCGKEPPDECNITSDFCPSCGADMRAEEKEE